MRIFETKDEQHAIFEVDGKFYPCELNRKNGQIYSLPQDCKHGKYFANMTDLGAQYVSIPRETLRKAKRAIYYARGTQ